MSNYEEWARQFVHDCVVSHERFEDRVKKLVEKFVDIENDTYTNAFESIEVYGGD